MYVFEILAVMAGIASSVALIFLFVSPEIWPSKTNIVLAITFMILQSVFLLNEAIIPYGISCFAFIILLVCVNEKQRWFHSCLVAIFLWILRSLPASGVALFTGTIDINQRFMLSGEITFYSLLIGDFISDCVIIIAVYKYRRFAQKVDFSLIEILPAFLLWCIAMFLNPFVWVDHRIASGGIRLYISACFAAIIILADILYFISLWKSKTTDYFKQLEWNNRKYIEQELQYFEIYKKSQNDMRKFRHDMKHHINMMGQLCKTDDMAALQNYLKSVQENWKAASEILYRTGDDNVDAILNAKAVQIQKDRIPITLSGAFSNRLSLSPFDICTIFANALDNAIEANRKISNPEERFISLSISKSDFYYMISIENPMADELSYTGQTTKSDHMNHGFGLRSIRGKVEQGGGSMTIVAKNKRFRLDILLPI